MEKAFSYQTLGSGPEFHHINRLRGCIGRFPNFLEVPFLPLENEGLRLNQES